ncbi:protein FAM177A1 [Gasterosteus aculeatus]
MNHSHQEPSPDEFGSPALSKQTRIIHFSSGETLEQEDSEEEEEEQSNRPPFREPADRTRLSFKSVALLVGRISMLTCDFVGERLAGALGLNAAKYQYAIDRHQRDQQTASSRAKDDPAPHLYPGAEGRGHYGAAGGPGGDERHVETSEGRHNRAYEADDCYK